MGWSDEVGEVSQRRLGQGVCQRGGGPSQDGGYRASHEGHEWIGSDPSRVRVGLAKRACRNGGAPQVSQGDLVGVASELGAAAGSGSGRDQSGMDEWAERPAEDRGSEPDPGREQIGVDCLAPTFGQDRGNLERGEEAAGLHLPTVAACRRRRAARKRDWGRRGAVRDCGGLIRYNDCSGLGWRRPKSSRRGHEKAAALTQGGRSFFSI